MRVIQTFECQQQSADDCSRFSYTETCSFRGSQTRMIVSAGLSDSYATLLFPFSRACFRVVKAVGILIPDPATERGQRYDRTHPYSGTHAC